MTSAPPQAPPLPPLSSRPSRPITTAIPSFAEHYATFVSKATDIKASANTNEALPTGYYLVHNDLMTPSVLSTTLGLTPQTLPLLKVACIVGYSLALTARKQKVLLAAEPPAGELVRGLAVELLSRRDVEAVMRYMRTWRQEEEGQATEYEVVDAEIHFTDEGASVKGWCFVYKEDRAGLVKPGFYRMAVWGKQVEAAVEAARSVCGQSDRGLGEK